MTIESTKTYKVEKYESNGAVIDYGFMTGRDVKALLKGYGYDADCDMWFTPKAYCAYNVVEA